QAYCSQNQSYYSEWSVRDTFYIGNFVAEAFTPEINITLSSLICEELSDINFITEQGLNEPDIQSTSVTSNLGYINLDNLEMGQNVGNATAIAGINNFINNEYSLEISEINSVENSIEIDLVNDDEETQFSFTIENLEGGGVEMSIVSPSDNNSYTSGNSLDINLTGIFMNPSPSLLQFDVTVFSELNDDIFNQFDFNIDCANTIATFDNVSLFYPNPTYSVVNLMVENLKAIKIFDTKGQLMLFDENPTNSIDVSQLSQGLYFVEIISDGKSSVEQLIVR
ncbi:MAG: T9SS type A sorting domain-containing protein, partial [Flavobacteriales bacterium]